MNATPSSAAGELDKVLTELENAVWYNAAMINARQVHKSKAPKQIHAEAKAKLQALIEQECLRARLDEVNTLSFDASGEDYTVDQFWAHLENRETELKQQLQALEEG